MNDVSATSIRPIPMEVTVTITAIVNPEPEAGGFSAEVPSLPGCYTEGDSLDELRTNLREAIEGWLSSAHDKALQVAHAARV